MRRRCEGPVPGHGPPCVPLLSPGHDPITLFTEGDALYEAMVTSIAGARRRVWLESYIFASDEVGWRFARVMAKRADEGLDVRLHVDAVGSLGVLTRTLLRFLRGRGVRVRIFRRWSGRRPLAYNQRNHRKILVVDETVAYLGGFNIHQASARSISGAARWRDTHVSLGGALVEEAANLLAALWERKRHWSPGVRPGVHSRILPNHLKFCDRRLRCLYTDMFAQARASIAVTTPYFVPDRRTQSALMDAVRRAIDVRLLVPRRSAVALARWAGWAVYGELLEAGVRIFEYLPRVLHAKSRNGCAMAAAITPRRSETEKA